MYKRPGLVSNWRAETQQGCDKEAAAAAGRQSENRCRIRREYEENTKGIRSEYESNTLAPPKQMVCTWLASRIPLACHTGPEPTVFSRLIWGPRHLFASLSPVGRVIQPPGQGKRAVSAGVKVV